VAASTSREGKTVVEAAGLQVAPEAGAAPLNEPFDLVMSAGDRIGIVGQNGIGKTTFVRAILDAFEGQTSRVAKGSITVGKNTRTAYLDQARQGLDDDKSVFDDVKGEGGSTVVSLGSGQMDLRSYLELFLFDGQAQRQNVGSLSGGERARVALAKTLRQGANLLVFDEPTNDLDLATLAALEELLSSYEGSVLVVTHDRAFLDRVATAILAFDRGTDDGIATVTRYAGGYTDYVLQRGERVTRSIPPPPAQAAAPAPKTKAKSGLTYGERLELEGIVDAIDQAEKKVAAVETLLADPTLYSKRGTEVAALQSKLEEAKQAAAALVKRWEDLEAKKGI
jgi:ATP-binding cassette subfamily F protein uup